MDENPTPQDAPVAAPVEPTPNDVPDQPVAPEAPAGEEQPSEPAAAPAAPPEPEEDEDENFLERFQAPQIPQLDFSQLPVGEDNLIDPNALAGAINQQVMGAVESAKIAARQEYAEQRAEEKAWEKAYEKHPELRNDKELRALVHRARLGEVTDVLSRTQDPSSVKLPTPGQVADKLFKYMGTAKQEGMKQATENTVIQASAHVESGARRSEDADTSVKAFQNINSNNPEVRKAARSELLRQRLGWD